MRCITPRCFLLPNLQCGSSAGRHVRHALRCSIVLILIVVMATGCSTTVEVPREQIESGTRRDDGIYRIRTVDKEKYDVRIFSMTDSTLVIEKLNATDARYKKAELPIVLARDNVSAVSKYELARGRSFFALAGSFLFVMAIISIGSAFPSSS